MQHLFYRLICLQLATVSFLPVYGQDAPAGDNSRVGFRFRTPEMEARLLKGRGPFDIQDTLRGMLTPLRTAYDVTYYNIYVRIDLRTQRIAGKNEIVFRTVRQVTDLQFDLVREMAIDSIVYRSRQVFFERLGNTFIIHFPQKPDSIDRVSVYFSGKPRIAPKPPWDGGFVWSKDFRGNAWVGLACEGLGASVWLPCKDHLSDEPDSAQITISVMKPFAAISNGQFVRSFDESEGYAAHQWKVSYPINSYNITLYIGDYVTFHDTLLRADGSVLSLDYYVMQNNLQAAQTHFQQVKPMLRCFEARFGKYPFEKDGYALVESPYWGMEHQSAIAYGNQFKNNAYLFDFIIVHESGHEWFGNSVSVADHADMWIHEAFTTYAEIIYIEYYWGYEKACAYLRSQQKEIANVEPILGPLHLNYNNWPDADMYYKGSSMLHTLRSAVNNDSVWFNTIRSFYQHFKMRSDVNSDTAISFLCRQLNYDWRPFFNQYLSYTRIPTLVYSTKKKGRGYELTYYFEADDSLLTMPVEVKISEQETRRITVSTKPQTIFIDKRSAKNFTVNLDKYYIQMKEIRP